MPELADAIPSTPCLLSPLKIEEVPQPIQPCRFTEGLEITYQRTGERGAGEVKFKFKGYVPHWPKLLHPDPRCIAVPPCQLWEEHLNYAKAKNQTLIVIRDGDGDIVARLSTSTLSPSGTAGFGKTKHSPMILGDVWSFEYQEDINPSFTVQQKVEVLAWETLPLTINGIRSLVPVIHRRVTGTNPSRFNGWFQETSHYYYQPSLGVDVRQVRPHEQWEMTGIQIPTTR